MQAMCPGHIGTLSNLEGSGEDGKKCFPDECYHSAQVVIVIMTRDIYFIFPPIVE